MKLVPAVVGQLFCFTSNKQIVIGWLHIQAIPKKKQVLEDKLRGSLVFLAGVSYLWKVCMSERIYNLNNYIVDSACLNYMTGNAKKFLNMHHCDGI